ncbi:MAG: peptide deformylase [Proteobacteria bacterium]|nr:peptide deformylase [Pseudomonadota bacterium]
MAIQPIARMGAEILKRRAVEVTDFKDPNLPVLVNDMIDTMMSVRGIGLAAPQISVSRRVVIFFVPGERNGGVEIPLTVMLNPVLNPTNLFQAEGWEACLSVPGLTGRVPRYTGLRYSYYDLKGQKHEVEAKDFHARVVQHECDHLDGILYPQRMADMTSLSFADVLSSEAAAAGKKLDLDPEG